MPIRPLPLPRECHLHHHIAAPTYLALPISDGDIRRPALTQCPLLYAWPPCLAKVGLASHSEARPPPPTAQDHQKEALISCRWVVHKSVT